jgi:Ser/Thr protein kinase RdoA (MazF antagonist)
VAGRRDSREELAALGRRFTLDGELVSAQAYGSGHINSTFLVTYRKGGRRVRYIQQRLNRAVFPDPEAVMRNIARVLDHLRRKLAGLGAAELVRRVLTLVPARDGRAWTVDDAGEVWRTYLFIEGARCHERAEEPREAFEVARAFGRFQRLLLDLSGPRLHETIRDFHHTPRRLAAFRRALDADPANRAGRARAEIEFVTAHAHLADGLLRLQEHGLLAERVIHNDTKINNVMLDEQTGEGLCVIDLDTVMPGLALFDFGDMVRGAAGTAREDEPDAGAVAVRPEVFVALAQGFLSELEGVVTPAERESLVLATQVMTYECGLRFLTDFLEGDTYFKVHRPGHNLDRCRTQLGLLRSLLEREEELRRLVERIEPFEGGGACA